MPELAEGTLTIDFGIVKLSGKLSELDRQCAWQLYTEIVTRVAITGKKHDKTCNDFTGEILVESLSSLHTFFQEARNIMRIFPVGKLKEKQQLHLGTLIHIFLTEVLHPFLEKWQADIRMWWELQDRSNNNWFELQTKYPRYEEIIEDWAQLRKIMRKLEHKLQVEYKLHRVTRN